MGEAEYLRVISQRCFDLSAHCYQLEIAARLRELGEELAVKASECGERRAVFFKDENDTAQ